MVGLLAKFINVREVKRQIEPRRLGDTEENSIKVGANGRVVIRLAASPGGAAS